jgi:hypothetical protein
MLGSGATPRVVARRLFLYDPNNVFQQDPERGFEILDEVRAQFKVPFSSIRVAGSAQLGFSCYQNRDFIPQESDLDIAIISQSLFQSYSEFVYGVTKRYSDLTGFGRTVGQSNAQQFRSNLGNGYFRPDLMPNCKQKDDWFRFFNQLGTKHTDWFKSINAGIYLSEAFFEMKNSSIVDDLGKASK